MVVPLKKEVISLILREHSQGFSQMQSPHVSTLQSWLGALLNRVKTPESLPFLTVHMCLEYSRLSHIAEKKTQRVFVFFCSSHVPLTSLNV